MSKIMDYRKYIIPLFLLAMGQPASATTIFKPECTKPKDPVNFVSAPTTRGTLNIFWNCLFTIVACTWSVHYLNVPEQRDGRFPGKMGDFRWAFKGVIVQLRWMVVTIIAPEYILLKALERRSTCKMINGEFQSHAKKDCVPWSLSHTHFAHMGGFVIRHSIPDPIPEPILRVYGTTPEQYGWPCPHEVILDRSERGANIPAIQAAPVGDNIIAEKEIEEVQADNEPALPSPFHLTYGALIGLRLDGFFRLPKVYEEELKDRSKSDTFTKIVALFQIFITVVDVVTRWIRHMPISQLEISVLAFAFCAIMIHVACWDSPQEVATSVTLAKYEGPIPDQILDCIVRTQGEPLSGKPLANHFMADPVGPAMLVGIVGSMIFAGFHLLAWNSAFPTWIEQVVWRFTTSFCVGICAWWFLIFGFSCLKKSFYRETVMSAPERIHMNIVQKVLVYPSLAVYVVARLFIIGESFRALAYLPPDSYVSTWAANFPWFG